MRRRRFLKVALASGATVAVAGAGLALWPARIAYRPREALRVLSPTEFAILAAVAARVVTSPAHDPVATAHGVDAMISRTPLEAQHDFQKLLHTIESALAGLLLDGRMGTFTHLDPAAQDRVLFAFRDSRLPERRAGYQALRKLCAGVYYGRESAWPESGYPGPPQIALPPSSAGEK